MKTTAMRVANNLAVAAILASAVDAAVVVRQVIDTTTDGLSTSTTLPTSTFSTSAATTTSELQVATSTPSPPAVLNATLPAQAPLAPLQSWCPSDIFCNGPLLQTINIAQLYGDSKTFVDKPTVSTPNVTLNDFDALYNTNLTGGRGPITNYSSVTYGAVEKFVELDFQGEGLELESTLLPSNSTPPFLSPNTTSITSPIILGWAEIVNSYWSDLVRETNQSEVCDGVRCESTLIPLNHTFVVPGGRFREQYYWDSYWIIEGLIQSELYSIAASSLQNFMDELEKYGFIPNGGRIYYLNRSQPPLFMKMLYSYVIASNDTSILERALPLAETELTWWYTHRTINVTSPNIQGKSWEVAHYAVVNTAPRPEGFLEDYQTANGPDVVPALTEAQKEALYAELASGAESGHDYTGRWATNPYLGNVTDQAPLLRTLNVRSTVPVDLNSILYKYRVLLAELYQLSPSNTSSALASHHLSVASTLRSAILDLFWSPSKLAFYDYNLTSSSQNTWFSPANFYPYWSGIVPDEVLSSEENAVKAFSSVRMVMSRYNGTFPASFVQTGLQWDAPNAWPPHQFIIIEALKNLPPNITLSGLTPLSNSTSSFDLVPVGQLGLNETALPVQPIDAIGSNVTAPTTGSAADINKVDEAGTTVLNGGDVVPGETWNQALGREMANRYMASVFCSWYATGGSIPGLLPRLSDAQLNLTFSLNNTGNMFEKESLFDIDVSGSGGEYTVQAGFGWTNGVVLYLASQYGSILSTPNCPTVSAETIGTTSIELRRSLAENQKRKASAWFGKYSTRGRVVNNERKALSRKGLLGRAKKMIGWMN